MGDDHYERGEKAAAQIVGLTLVMRPKWTFDAVVYGFPPGKSDIKTPLGRGKAVLDPLIREILKPVVVAPGTNRTAYREVHIYGSTDRVQFKSGKNGKSAEEKDRELRTARAAAFKRYLAKLLPNHASVTMVPKPMLKSQKPYIGKGGGLLLRAQNRAVGIILVVPPLPAGCYAAGTGPSEKDTIEFLRKSLNDPGAERILGRKDTQFMKRLVELLVKKGNDEYVTKKSVQDGLDRWLAEYRPQYQKLLKLSPQKRDEYGKRYGVGSFPSVGSKQMIWYSNLTNAILREQKPQVFEMYSISLMTELRKLVRAKCRNTPNVQAALAAYVGQIRNGRNSVHQTRDFRHGLAEVFGGGSAIDSFIKTTVRDWMAKKEKAGNSVYSVYIEVYGK